MAGAIPVPGRLRRTDDRSRSRRRVLGPHTRLPIRL